MTLFQPYSLAKENGQKGPHAKPTFFFFDKTAFKRVYIYIYISNFKMNIFFYNEHQNNINKKINNFEDSTIYSYLQTNLNNKILLYLNN